MAGRLISRQEEHTMTTSPPPGCPVAHGYDPLAPSTVLDPYPVLNGLRRESPVFYVPELDHYLVTRMDDILGVLTDRETWSASNASSPLIPICERAQKVLAEGYRRVPTLNNADPPRHGPMRRSVLTTMTPRRLKALEPSLRAYANGLIDALEDEEQVDLVAAFAFPFPGYAAFTLLGFPPEDTEMLRQWSEKRVLLTYGRNDDDTQVAIAEEIVAFWQYVERHVERCAAEPGDDLTSDLVQLARAQPELCNDFDIVNMVYSMALAAHETTTNTIASGLRALLERPDQWRSLIDDRTLIENAVEEILRFDGPVLNHRRLANVATEIGGVPIPAGGKVMMCFASAGHDPAHFADPDEFLVTRENAVDHLAFGKGPHFCLGAPLGRLETRIALELFTRRLPEMTLVEQTFEYSPNALFRGLKRLLVRPNRQHRG
jgi:cytochrome P450